MQLKQYLSYLAATQSFFHRYEDFLKQRMEGLSSAAIGPSRYVSFFLAQVAYVNVLRVRRKLQDFAKKPEDYLQNAEKMTDYLLRAREVLRSQAKNSQDSAIYIPVDPHVQEARNAQEQLDRCDTVLQLYGREEFTQKKSWFVPLLWLGSFLVAIRVAGQGLAGRIFGADITDEKRDQNKFLARERLVELQDELEFFHQRNKVAPKPATRTTQRHIGCLVDDMISPFAALFHYFPKELPQAIAKFEALDPAQINGERVLDAVKVEFPEPPRAKL